MRAHFLHPLLFVSLAALIGACSSSKPNSGSPAEVPSSRAEDSDPETTPDAQPDAAAQDPSSGSDAGETDSETTGSGSLSEYVPPKDGPKPWFETIEPPAAYLEAPGADDWSTQFEHVSDSGAAAIGSAFISSTTTQRSGQALFHWSKQAGSAEIPLPEELGGLDPAWLKAEALAVASSAGKVVVRLTGHGTTHWYVWSEKGGSQLLTPGEDVTDLAVDLFSTNNEVFVGSLRLADDRVLPFYALGTSVFRVSLGSHTTHTDACAISHNASVLAGNTIINERSRVYRWELDRGVRILDLPEGYSDCWLGRDMMSSNGAVLVMTCSNDEHRHAFRWQRDGELERLETPSDSDAFPAVLSADGATAVGELRQQSAAHVFVHRQDAAHTITPSEGLLSYPLWTRESISADGSVVLGQAQDPQDHARGFFWSRDLGAITLLPLRGHSDTWVTAIADDGRTIAGHSGKFVAGDMQTRPVIWRGDDKPLSISSALAGAGLDSKGIAFEGTANVTGDGRHVWGTGVTADGQHRAWMVHLP